MLNLIYQAATFLISLALTPIFFLHPRVRPHLSERFGFWNLSSENCIWFHGASLGEINGLIPVIKLFRKMYPQLKILITTTSVSGRNKAGEIADFAFLMPFDSAVWFRNALSKTKLKAAIITETEIWPGQINYLKKRNIPLYLINGRISDFTLPRYMFFKRFIKKLLANFKFISVVNEEAKHRFELLGANPLTTVATGNSKYDIPPSIKSSEAAGRLKTDYFRNPDPVLVLGSIRPGEQEIWFQVISNFQQKHANLNVVVAPRHKEKFNYFADKLKEFNLPYKRRSEMNGKPAENEKIILLDTIGDLESVYSFADIVFVGATIVDLGGHNPLEPAAYGACICIGEHYKNIRDVVKEMQEREAIVVLKDAAQAESLIASMINRDPAIKKFGLSANEVWKTNVGAAQRIFQHISIELQ